MPGVASILNKAVANEAQIHLFYNTDKSNLGLILRDGTQDGSDSSIEFVANNNDSETGIIPNQSELSATTFKDVKLIFGITSKKTATGTVDEKTHDVSIVSPVYQPLASTASNFYALASASTAGDFHVFFLGTGKKDQILIKNYTQSTGESGHLTNAVPQENTDLAAYTIGRSNFVIYHSTDESGFLHEYSLDGRAITPIKTATNVRPGSPLAVTHEESTGRTYAYYVQNNTNQLTRVIKTGTAWGSATAVDTATPVGSETQLTATLANKTNHLFYVEDGNYTYAGGLGKFKHVWDNITV